MPPEGYRLVSQVLDPALIASLGECAFGHGQRDILRREPKIAALVQLPIVQDLVTSALSPTAQPISGIWFDKAPGANWWVPWHRDEHIPTMPFVAEGWGPWRDKDGVPHVVCPEPWRSRRVALRFHLDDADATQGALEVAPGSHLTTAMEPAGPTSMIEVRAGDVLVMHPLLLHRSRPAQTPRHRRVIHLEWCDLPLPGEGHWVES